MKKTEIYRKDYRQIDIKCKECDKTIESITYNRFEVASIDTHSKGYSCKVCEQSYEVIWKLEGHMENHDIM